MQLVMTTTLLPGFSYKQVGKETFKPPLQIKQTFSLKAKIQLQLNSEISKICFAFIKTLLTSVEKITSQFIQQPRLI